MFGFKIVTKSKLERIKTEAQNKAVADLVELLKKANKIFLEPVTFSGGHHVIKDSVFLGTGAVFEVTHPQEKERAE